MLAADAPPALTMAADTEYLKVNARPHPCPVLILNYNGWSDTIAGLAAMRPHVADLWLIDNASPNQRLDEVAALYPEVRMIALPENYGWAGAYNRTIEIAASEGHDAVYILNNDAVLRPGALEQALVTLRSAPDIAAVGSAMLDSGGTRAFFDGEWHWDQAAIPAPLLDDVREVRSIHGGGFALSIAAYRDVGPFHEDYFLYHEESDWCLRARAAGWRVLVDRASRCDHEGEGSSTGFNRLYYIARNRFLARRRGIALRDRDETRFSIVQYEFLNAAPLSLPAREAVAAGLIDGLRSRFGQRRTTASRFITVPLAVTMPGLFRLKRKITHLLVRGDAR